MKREYLNLSFEVSVIEWSYFPDWCLVLGDEAPPRAQEKGEDQQMSGRAQGPDDGRLRGQSREHCNDTVIT